MPYPLRGAGPAPGAPLDPALGAWLTRSMTTPWTTVHVAREGRAFHTIDFADGTAAYLPVGARDVLADVPLGLRIEESLARFHSQLLVGETGEAVLAVLGVAAAVTVTLGFANWWPRRRASRWRDLRPRSASRPLLLRLHASLGALSAVVLVTHVFSGALLANNPAVRAWLAPLAPESARPRAPAMPIAFASGDATAALDAAMSALPGGQPSQVSRVESNDGPKLSLKLRLPGERHPNGRSTVLVDLGSGTVEKVRDARAGGVPAAYDDVLYPLHVAFLFGGVHRALWTLGALALASVAGAGAWAFARRGRSRRSNSG